MEVVWQIEADAWCNKILARHWPEVTRYDDITTVDPGELEWVDLMVGGFPCQDLSVAGRREGLAGSRSSLFWEFLRIADALRPRWLLIENVPGLFSSQSGRDYLQIVSALDERGYGVAWRVLDSQHFGVAQRRRRVFIVGHLGAPCPPEVLFESAGGAGDPAAGLEAGADVAASLTGGTGSDGQDAESGNLVVHALRRDPGGIGQGWNTSYALNGKKGHRYDGESNTFVVNARQDPISSKDQSLPLDAGHPQHAVAFAQNQRRELRTAPVVPSLNIGGGKPGEGYPAVLARETADPDGVREATGLPRRVDPDGPRYRGLGNAVTVPVIRWIGERILKVDAAERG